MRRDKTVTEADLEAVLAPSEEEITYLLSGNAEAWPDGLLGEYADGGLTAAQRVVIKQALEGDDRLRERYNRLRAIQSERDAEFLEKLLGGEHPHVRLVVVEASPPDKSLLFTPAHLSVAATEVRGGSVQTADRFGRVSLTVEQILDATMSRGELEIRVRSLDERLHESDGRFELLVDGEPRASIPVPVRAGRFIGRLRLDPLPVAPSQVRYRLTLEAQHDDAPG
jgi:anti-sigma factor RsiW